MFKVRCHPPPHHRCPLHNPIMPLFQLLSEAALQNPLQHFPFVSEDGFMNHPDFWQGEDNFQVEGYKPNKTQNYFSVDAQLIYFMATSSVPFETYPSAVSLLNYLMPLGWRF